MKNDYIDMHDNGTRPESTTMSEHKRRPRYPRWQRVHITEVNLGATDIITIICIICGTVLVGIALVLAYKAGLMIGVLLLVGFLAFLALMLKSME